MNLSRKPCRIIHCYKIVDGVSYVVAFDGMIRLNKTATIVWKMADGKHTVEDIINKFREMYKDVSLEMLEEDIGNIIHNLEKKGVLLEDWDPLLKDNISYKEMYKWMN